MTQYEYTLVNRDQAERLVFAQDMINEMGSQGFRLTIVSEWFFVFEREIPIIPTFVEPEPDVG